MNDSNDSFVELVENSLVGGLSPTIRLDYTDTKRPTKGRTLAKIIQSGSLLETYDYDTPIHFGHKRRPYYRKPNSLIVRSEEYKRKSIIRAMNQVRRLAHLNFTENDKFLTLTFNNDQRIDINNLQACLPFFQIFVRKMRKKYPSLRYIAVPEFQKRGAVHYHMLCNIPFIVKSDLEKLWPYGFSKPKAIRGTTHLALYLCKYLSKRFKKNKKHGHKLFYSSRGLKQPTVYYGLLGPMISGQLRERRQSDMLYQTLYIAKYNGMVLYSQYCKKKNE